MVHQSITVFGDMSRKPVHSVEQKGVRTCDRSLLHSTERKLAVKGKDHDRKQRRECGALHFHSNVIRTPLLLPKTSPFNVTFHALTKRQPIP